MQRFGQFPVLCADVLKGDRMLQSENRKCFGLFVDRCFRGFALGVLPEYAEIVVESRTAPALGLRLVFAQGPGSRCQTASLRRSRSISCSLMPLKKSQERLYSRICSRQNQR